MARAKVEISGRVDDRKADLFEKYQLSQKNIYIVWSSVTYKIKAEFWQNDIFQFTNELT